MSAVRDRMLALADEWDRDDAEHLSAYGHHRPVGLAQMAELLRKAVNRNPAREHRQASYASLRASGHIDVTP